MAAETVPLPITRNAFGAAGLLHLETARHGGKTVLKDVRFTAPMKLSSPFAREDGGLRTLLLCASAGLMAGDQQELAIQVGEGSCLEFSTQSYEKIHRMETGMARRTATISVERSATLLYLPLPSIPFAGSAFVGETHVRLADSTSRLALFDAVTCGRAAMGERFAYRFHRSRTRIYRGDSLVYRDVACYEPGQMPMNSIGFYEGYSCAASLLLFGWEDAGPLLEEQLQAQGDGISWGFTQLHSGDWLVRLLGFAAQQLVELSNSIVNYLK